MKNLIHSYLKSNGYYIRGNHMYKPNNEYCNVDIFICELIHVFDLSKKKLKPYVKSWVRKQNKGFDFDLFWNRTIDLSIKSVIFTGITRRLRATWSPELIQDLEAYHNIDAEAELTAMLSEQIAQIDRETLRGLPNIPL